jgi:hypothetical protein
MAHLMPFVHISQGEKTSALNGSHRGNKKPSAEKEAENVCKSQAKIVASPFGNCIEHSDAHWSRHPRGSKRWTAETQEWEGFQSSYSFSPSQRNH